MSGYIGSKASVTQVDGYNRTEADSEFVQVTGDTMAGDLTITGTLDVDNVTDGTTSVPTGYVVNGSAKSWVNFNGTGTVAIRDSFNVSSLTDIGVGNYAVNLTAAMANTTYSGSGSSWRGGIGFGIFATVPSTASVVAAGTANDAGGYSDNSDNSMLIHGDLA